MWGKDRCRRGDKKEMKAGGVGWGGVFVMEASGEEDKGGDKGSALGLESIDWKAVQGWEEKGEWEVGRKKGQCRPLVRPKRSEGWSLLAGKPTAETKVTPRSLRL